MRRVVSLHLPTWSTDRLRRRLGGACPPERPLVTALRDGPRRVVAAADAAARCLGLRSGLPLAHARALVPGLAVARADPAGDEAGLGRLAAWCLRYSPLAAPDPPDGVWLDVSGCAHLCGGEAALLDDLMARLGRDGFAARAAVADTPGAAWAAARFGADTPVIVPPGGAAAALAGLPVAALRLAAPTVDALRRLGFERVGQLYGTPRAPLTLRFGPEVARRLDQALGHAFEPITPLTPPAPRRRRLAFAEPIGDPGDLKRATSRLAAALCADLEAAGEGARRLDLLCHRTDGRIAAVRVGTARPSRDPGHLARLLAERLEAVDPGLGIEAVVLAAPVVEPLGARQLVADLVEGDDAGGDDLAALVDRLANRLGPDRLYRLAPVESDVPERSIARLPALAPPTGVTWPAALPRPSRLLAPPEPVRATALLPDHPPVLFVWRGARHRVRRADGPERVVGEWWRAPAEVAAVRDYYRLEDAAGARFWLFRGGAAGAGGRWWLHGLFG